MNRIALCYLIITIIGIFSRYIYIYITFLNLELIHRNRIDECLHKKGIEGKFFWNPKFVQLVLFRTSVDPEKQTRIAAKGVPLGYNSV